MLQRGAILFMVPGILVLALAPSQGDGAAWFKRTDTDLGLGNESIELWCRMTGTGATAVRLVNHLSKRNIPLSAEDFSIGIEGRKPLRAADFTLLEAQEEFFPGGRRIRLRLEHPGTRLKLDLVYELGDDDFFLRRRLELTPAVPLPLREIVVLQVNVGGTCSHQGFGRPVLLEETFWGLEFPAGHNGFSDGMVRLVQYPGRTITERFTSKTAVIGVAERGQAVPRFRKYVETFRVTPSQTSLFVNYNTWWTLMPPTEKNSLELIGLFKKKLFDPYGESFDTFTLDSGWDDTDSLWALRADRFPRGFAPLVESLKGMKGRLGIWLSPSSGYGHAPWLSKHGYAANSNPWFICQSDPKYRRDIVRTVTELAKKYDVAFFKFDGFAASCDSAGHAHLPGPYAQEANTEAFIELMTAVRAQRPDIYLDPTCGIWLSPWWLRYADSLWGNVSGDYPDIIVPAPIIRDSATTTRDGVFRQRCHENPGFPPAAIEHLGIIVITPEKWEDNAMIVVGRGCRLLTLYIDPRHFQHGDRDWAFLAALLKWVRHNASVLQRTELILGDPMKREPYGYAHFSGQKGILALRNPFIEARKVQVKLDASVGWQRPAAAAARMPPLVAQVIYPRREVLRPCLYFGDTLELELQGYETVVIQLEPSRPSSIPVVCGLRSQVLEQAGNKITWTVHGRPGQKGQFPLTGTARVEKATLDGRPITPGKGIKGILLPLEFSGTSPSCEVKEAQLTVVSAEKTPRLVATSRVTVPAGVKATMHVVYEPGSTAAPPLQCAALVDGKSVPVRAIRNPEKSREAHGPHPWTWYEFDLPIGQYDVSFTMMPAKPGRQPAARVGWWIRIERPLEKKTLTLELAEPLPPVAELLPLPLFNDREYETLTLRPFRLLPASLRWNSESGPIFLDEIPPEDVTQDYGKLERNQSVWRKPMVIAGRSFSRGLGAHANSLIRYDLSDEKFKTFRATVGRDEHAGDGKLVFQVFLDGKKAFDSGPMTRDTPGKVIDLRIEGVRVLELRANDGGDGISGDHANWAEAQLVP